MQKLRQIIQKGFVYIFALVLVAGYPVAAMADTQEPVTESTPPTTVQETPPQPEPPKLNYTYNSTTGRWDSDQWQYNAQSGTYETPPAPTVITPQTDTTSKDKQSTTDTADVTIDNTINSNATSGNSAVSNNTTGGNASTGDAAVVANLLNIVNSSITTGDNQKVATFTQDIYGDVKGDIVLYPMLLKAMLEAKANTGTSSSIDATTNFNIDNKVNLTAQSGDAAVTNNTTGGNATSGSATAVANVVNILNSMIAAQDSFMGTINIYGNLEGDILIAPDFIPQMLANNGNNTANSNGTKISSNDTTTIVNNISAVAESGAAEVFGNTKGGDATSGDADSNVVIFNVTGHEIVAKNSLLVFVNVMGKWVGMIVDAPANTTAALIGNGVTTNTTHEPDLTINAESNHGITNTISVNAQSGDATVAHNTTGGNAVSGQAKALANVANVSGSQIGATDWFGVLFINVFQNWYGSFDIDTPYGDSVVEEQTEKPAPTGPIQFIPVESPPAAEQRAPRVVLVDSRAVQNEPVAAETTSTPTVLGSTASAKQVNNETPTTAKETTLEAPYDFRMWIIAGSIFVIGASAIGIRRLLQ